MIYDLHVCLHAHTRARAQPHTHLTTHTRARTQELSSCGLSLDYRSSSTLSRRSNATLMQRTGFHRRRKASQVQMRHLVASQVLARRAVCHRERLWRGGGASSSTGLRTGDALVQSSGASRPRSKRALAWGPLPQGAGHRTERQRSGNPSRMFVTSRFPLKAVALANMSVADHASGACCLGFIHSRCPTGKVVQACCRARKLGSDVPPRTDPPRRQCRRTQRS